MYSITQFSHMIEQKMANNVVFPKLTIINETSVFIIRKLHVDRNDKIVSEKINGI